MTRIRVLLADDNTQILELLHIILEPEFQVVGAAEDGEALLQYAHRLQPDVIISDIDMPKVDGLQAARLLKDIAPHTRIIFLSGHSAPCYIDEAFAVGAAGYLIKGATTDLVAALRSIIGNIHIPTPAPSGHSRAIRPPSRAHAGKQSAP